MNDSRCRVNNFLQLIPSTDDINLGTLNENVRYINIQTWFRGFLDKLQYFVEFSLYVFFFLGNLGTKKLNKIAHLS